MSLPDFTTTNRARSTAIPWHHAGHRILRPFSQEWETKADRFCHECKAMVSVGSDSAFEGCVYAFKEWCLRCGSAITSSVYNQDLQPDLGRRAMAWARSREEITR